MKQPAPSHPIRWVPELWEFGRKRVRAQARMMALSMLVGLIAGGGAVVFFAACQAVSYAALDRFVGYRPHAPGGEPPLIHRLIGPSSCSWKTISRSCRWSTTPRCHG